MSAEFRTALGKWKPIKSTSKSNCSKLSPAHAHLANQPLLTSHSTSFLHYKTPSSKQPPILTSPSSLKSPSLLFASNCWYSLSTTTFWPCFAISLLCAGYSTVTWTNISSNCCWPWRLWVLWWTSPMWCCCCLVRWELSARGMKTSLWWYTLCC